MNRLVKCTGSKFQAPALNSIPSGLKMNPPKKPSVNKDRIFRSSMPASRSALKFFKTVSEECTWLRGLTYFEESEFKNSDPA